MCKFCDKIYPEKDVSDIVFDGQEAFITACDDGTYDIIVDPGDPYELGLVPDIKFCPYCGEKLPERIRFDRGCNYDIKMVTRGRCMMCGKDLTEGLFFCKGCEEKVKYNLINHKESKDGRN